jgi:hypothetical protein
VAFLIVLVGSTRPAFADASTSAPEPKFSAGNPTAPFGWSNAIADLNADGRPDIVVTDRLGRRGSSRYRIDIRLSGRGRQLITFLSTAGDVRIRAVDIDHDHDVDLVATPLLGQRVIGVWLNDGSGHFVESHTATVPQGDLGPMPATSGGAMVEFASLPPPRRLHLASPEATRVAFASVLLAAATPTSDSAHPTSPDVCPSSPRAPPTSILLL